MDILGALSRIYEPPAQRTAREGEQLSSALNGLAQVSQQRNMKSAGKEMMALLADQGPNALDAKTLKDISDRYNLDATQTAQVLSMIQQFRNFLMPTAPQYQKMGDKALLQMDPTGRNAPQEVWTAPAETPKPSRVDLHNVEDPTQTSVGWATPGTTYAPPGGWAVGAPYQKKEPTIPALQQGINTETNKPGFFQMTQRGPQWVEGAQPIDKESPDRYRNELAARWDRLNADLRRVQTGQDQFSPNAEANAAVVADTRRQMKALAKQWVDAGYNIDDLGGIVTGEDVLDDATRQNLESIWQGTFQR